MSRKLGTLKTAKRNLIAVLQSWLSPKQLERVTEIYRVVQRVVLRLDFFLFNNRRLRKACQTGALRLHVGCGNKRIENYTNVDMVVGPRVDLLANLEEFQFPRNCCEVIFSHAFFEHISIGHRLRHLQGALQSLKNGGGIVCYIGMPYFRSIAELYLNGSVGPDGHVFDAERVLKFTHGGTTAELIIKGAAYARKWPMHLYAELHKALYDQVELKKLLRESGYASYVIFTTVYPKDKNPLPVNIGFYASNAQRSNKALREECKAYLRDFDGQYLVHDRISFFDE